MTSEAPLITERQFEQQVIDLARMHGWMVFKDRATNARRKCPKCGEDIFIPRNKSGWPDLTLIKPPRIIIAELKKGPKEQPTPEQREWLEVLAACPGVLTVVWRPDDWPALQAELTRR